MISLVIITTNDMLRFDQTLRTIQSFEPFLGNQIDEVVVSVDMFETHKRALMDKESMLGRFVGETFLKGDEVTFKKATGMMANQANGVRHAKGDIIIYAEDDIMVLGLPKRRTIEGLMDSHVIMFNHDLNVAEGKRAKYKKKHFRTFNGDVFYMKPRKGFVKGIRSYAKGKNLSMCFPLGIAHRSLFSKVYTQVRNEAIAKNVDLSIEASFSHAVNNSPLKALIFCKEVSIPPRAPWLYCDNSDVGHDTLVSGRQSSFIRLMSDDDVNLL